MSVWHTGQPKGKFSSLSFHLSQFTFPHFRVSHFQRPQTCTRNSSLVNPDFKQDCLLHYDLVVITMQNTTAGFSQSINQHGLQQCPIYRANTEIRTIS